MPMSYGGGGYFKNVIDWVEMKFIKYRKEMKGLMVVLLQQIHKDLNKNELERQISVLVQDSEVQNKNGIYGIYAKW